jgi:deazaflavin-dependent oxidoreductase (nitroreductase family)
MTIETTGYEELDYCYLTTTGRRTGRPHTIEIWFAVDDGHLYLLAGGGESADWVRNLRAEPRVGLRLGEQEGPARARVVDADEQDRQQAARRMLAGKYQQWRPGEPLSGWAQTALLVELEPEVAQ